MRARFFIPLIIAGIVFSVAYLIYQNNNDKSLIKELSLKKAEFKFNERKELFNSFVNKFDKTIFAIRDNKEFKSFVNDNADKSLIDELFLSIIKSSPDIFQLRFIDKQGLEKVRVDQYRGVYSIIPDDKLQNKKSRYYFDAIFNEKENSIWHSKIDLNIEHGKIVRPIQPTLRVGTPIIQNGIKKGILIINVDVKDFFNKLKTASIFNIYLIDQEGEFILHPNDSYSWGRYLNSKVNAFNSLKGLSKEILEKRDLKKYDFYIESVKFNNPDNIFMIIEPKQSKLVKEINENNLNRLYFVIFLLSIIFLAIYIIMKRRELQVSIEHNEELLENQEKIRSILDTQQSIVILSDGNEMTECNKRFLKFFKIKSLEEFKKDHSCICEFFEDDEEHEYLQSEMGTEIWSDYVFKRKDKIHKAKMTDKYNNKHFFIVNVRIYSSTNEKKEFVITFSDVTELEYLNNNLEQLVEDKTKALTELNNTLEEKIEQEVEKNRQKEKQLYEKEKMASMGEMIGDIAHHWRQPLSVISTAASGIVMQHDYKMLTDEYLLDTMEVITKTSQNLSQTIDNFSDLVQGDMGKTLFNVSSGIDKALSISDSTINDYYIKVIKDVDRSIEIFNSPNGLLQVLVNILNNSLEALAEDKTLVMDKYVFIKCYKKDDEVVITIKDNGGGIEPGMLSKVFQPYTTTKHKFQNTGLGLHMAYNIITKQMDGTIKADNEDFEFEQKDYIGAVFTISLPLK